jgi:hypothetical protein
LYLVRGLKYLALVQRDAALLSVQTHFLLYFTGPAAAVPAASAIHMAAAARFPGLPPRTKWLM